MKLGYTHKGGPFESHVGGDPRGMSAHAGFVAQAVCRMLRGGVDSGSNSRKMGGPQYRPQNTVVLILGTPKMVPLILGKSPQNRA